ncbi:MAG: Mini-ribonuclease 3 [Clostridia bacterium]|nr:Mini-ribonuclease 3 [Clostridia bacterium]
MNNFILDKCVAKAYNPIVLAYVGDAVHSLYVRHSLVLKSDAKAGDLHKKASKIVSAVSQSKLADLIYPILTEEEADIFRRARNSHTHSSAKNADIIDYKKASGLEAVFGYLYLTGQEDRLFQLFSYGEQL